MSFDLSAEAEAALAEQGPMLVLGGPGSGKTTLSLLKAQLLIQELEPGQEVLFLSFSRAAVRQVLSRCKDVLGREDRKRITVKTYHSFCMDVLRAHGRLLTGRQPRIHFPAAERLARAAHAGDWEAEQQRLVEEEGLYAFGMFASSCAGLLRRSMAVRRLLADRYPVVILDEFQDTDDEQWELVKLMSEGSRLIVLADPEQRIFEYDDRVDPERLNHLRAFLSPAEFDLGGANHRSPDAGILRFADAVLHAAPLPETGDVKLLTYWPRSFEATVHAAVVWLFGSLRSIGVDEPTVAVLCRANGFVADVSSLLGRSHTYNSRDLRPIDHDVIWDEEMSAAAAQVVASILEWPAMDVYRAAAHTLAAIADYFELKNATKPSSSARSDAERFRKAATQVADGGTSTIKAGKELLNACQTGVELNGSPAPDWLQAREVLAHIKDLREIYTNVRFVRLFRATDEIGTRLAERWAADGTYGHATEIVRQTLDMGRLLADQREPRGCVLMTMHKSKGKEFHGVVLVEGAHRSKFFDEREEAPHPASRRLLRVAITRARHRVVIVRPEGSMPLGSS